MKHRSAFTLTIIAILIASAATAGLLSIASIGGFDPSKRVITDPVEGTETQSVENPAAPQHPAFPSPAANNLSLPAGINGNNSLAASALVKVLMGMMLSLSISK